VEDVSDCELVWQRGHTGWVARRRVILAGQGSRRRSSRTRVDAATLLVRESLVSKPPRTIVLPRVTSSIVVCEARPFATWVGVGIGVGIMMGEFFVAATV